MTEATEVATPVQTPKPIQASTPDDKKDEVYVAVDESAEYPGGVNWFREAVQFCTVLLQLFGGLD